MLPMVIYQDQLLLAEEGNKMMLKPGFVLPRPHVLDFAAVDFMICPDQGCIFVERQRVTVLSPEKSLSKFR